VTVYDYDEAAAELRTTKTWLQRHINELPHTKLGRVVTFDDDDLARIRQIHHREPACGLLVEAQAQAQAHADAALLRPHPLAALKPLPARSRRAS
jgi:hypothetical protein